MPQIRTLCPIPFLIVMIFLWAYLSSYIYLELKLSIVSSIVSCIVMLCKYHLRLVLVTALLKSSHKVVWGCHWNHILLYILEKEKKEFIMFNNRTKNSMLCAEADINLSMGSLKGLALYVSYLKRSSLVPWIFYKMSTSILNNSKWLAFLLLVTLS